MIRVIIFIFLSLNLAFSAHLKSTEAFKVNATATSAGTEFRFNIDESVYLYADKLKFSINSKDITNLLNMPPQKPYKTSQIYDGNFTIFIPSGLILSSTNTLDSFSVGLEFIGCALDGYCYPPNIYSYEFTKSNGNFSVKFSDLSGVNSSQNSQSKNSLTLSKTDKIKSEIESSSFLITIITFFGYGLLLSLTPCIFPMVPILSSLLVSMGSKSAKSGLFISFIYVFAIALAYAIIGVSVSFVGSNLQGILQIPWVIILLALVFVLLSFSMFGLFKFQMPASIQTKISNKTSSKKGIIGVFIMGFFSALIVGPCVAAPLAGALLYIASSGDALLGGLALFSMGFASGVPLLLVGLGASKFLPKPGFWMDEVNKIFGFIMLFMAVWLFSRVVGENLSLLLYGVVGVFFASFMLPNATLKGGLRSFKFGLSFLAFLYSAILIIGFAGGAKSVSNPLNFISSSKNLALSNDKAQTGELNWTKISTLSELKKFVKTSKKPVIVDFWASWCVICKDLDKTLKKDEIREILGEFDLVLVDVTKSSDDDVALMSKFDLFGPPALLFFKDGTQISGEKHIGDIEALELKEKLKRVLSL